MRSHIQERTTLPDLISQAQPPLEFISPALNPLVVRVAQQVLPFWLASQTAITQIEAENVEVLVDLYRQFQDRKIRFLIAFRHPSVDDPLCMTHLLWRLVPQVAFAGSVRRGFGGIGVSSGVGGKPPQSWFFSGND